MNDFAKIIAQDLGRRVRQTLLNLNAIKDDATLYVWPRDERVVCLVDPLGIQNINALLSDKSHHQIQTACQGRRVVFTNHRGAFIQVAYYPEPHAELKAIPLDLAQQPSPLHVPIGMTKKGPLWLALPEMDAVLIGGARRMGKTRLLHGWIRSLQRGGQCKLFMWDGKNGLEFGRYAGETNTLVADDLHQALRPILDEVQQREVIFKTLKVSSLREHNAQSKLPLPYLVLVIDEATFIPKAAETVIVELVARCGAYGVHPVIATQRPDAEIMNGLLRANLSTRIALPVSSPGDSRVVLNRVGADKLPKQPGRLLMVWGALQLITGCSRRRLLGWCEKYRQEGVAGLVDKRQGGNAAKLSAEEIEHLQTMMSRYTPNQKYGKGKAVGGEFWTIADVRRLVKAECKVEYKSATSYRNLLDKCEMSYQKTQGVYKNRSTQKVSEFEELLEKN